jgi:hypothetical protein
MIHHLLPDTNELRIAAMLLFYILVEKDILKLHRLKNVTSYNLTILRVTIINDGLSIRKNKL